jgi:DNA ligase D-like protein (predicted 3'-phosphoesterase)
LPRFVVQLHDATTLHYDVRLELRGVMRSWAVPKGPSLDPAVKRLAVAVPDHAVQDVPFEGVYADASRGSGAVIVWDEGEFELVREEPDHLVVNLRGRKLAGGFALTRTGGSQWILVKMVDEDARRGSDIAAERPESVRSGRTWEQVAGG